MGRPAAAGSAAQSGRVAAHARYPNRRATTDIARNTGYGGWTNRTSFGYRVSNVEKYSAAFGVTPLGDRSPRLASALAEEAGGAIMRNVVALGALALWLATLALRGRTRVPARLWGFVVALYVLGPGLIVNALLKSYWGRARPAAVFEGEARFTEAVEKFTAQFTAEHELG